MAPHIPQRSDRPGEAGAVLDTPTSSGLTLFLPGPAGMVR